MAFFTNIEKAGYFKGYCFFQQLLLQDISGAAEQKNQ
jgi:hypothetical protein